MVKLRLKKLEVPVKSEPISSQIKRETEEDELIPSMKPN